jgi:hypothetical protein
MRATLLFLVLVGGALSSGWAQEGSGAAKSAKPKRQTNVISQEEIVAIQTEATDAYAVVARLRPQFMRIRGSKESISTSATPLEVKVVVDNATRGDLESLHQIPTSTLKEIRYLNGTDASIQFGTNYGGGAILVFTR